MYIYPVERLHILQENAKLVALQFPEGLLMFALTISDIIENFCQAQVTCMHFLYVGGH